MKKLFITSAIALTFSTAAFAQGKVESPPFSPNTAALMANPAPTAEHMRNHELYLRNLRAAGFTTKVTSPPFSPDTRFPDHSKVPHGPHYNGDTVGVPRG